jgi:hypothetical protein
MAKNKLWENRSLVRKTQELPSCFLTSKCGKLNKMSERNNKTQIPGPTLLLLLLLLLPPHTTTIHVVEMQRFLTSKCGKLNKMSERNNKTQIPGPTLLLLLLPPHTTTIHVVEMQLSKQKPRNSASLVIKYLPHTTTTTTTTTSSLATFMESQALFKTKKKSVGG